MEIKKATLEDVEWIVDIGIKDMFALIQNKDYYDPIYLKTIIIPFIISNHIALIVKDKGIILGLTSPHFYNPKVIMTTELMWWVTKEERNKTIGIRLLKAFEEEAKLKGSNLISLSLMSSSNIKNISKLGYSIKEYALTKEI